MIPKNKKQYLFQDNCIALIGRGLVFNDSTLQGRGKESLKENKSGIMRQLLYPMVFSILFLFIEIPSSTATQIIVDINGSGQTSSIQTGINIANNGDTVLVMPGTYFENINYNGKTLVVASLYLLSNNADYINQTTIDGNMQDGVVKAISGEGSGTRLTGFTIQNGLNSVPFEYGGGVSVLYNSSLSIEHCLIINNNSYSGGGIRTDDSYIEINSCTIKNNRAFWGSGGGICMVGNTNFFISNSSINNNLSMGSIGGLVIGSSCIGFLDEINRNSIYLNYGHRGSDIMLFDNGNVSTTIYLDTITSNSPDHYNIFLNNGYSYPVPNVLDIHYNHVALESTNEPIYVNPETGNNENSGLSATEPLKNIYYALLKLHSDENNPGTIYMANGTYGNFISGESFPLQARDYTSLVGESKEGVIWDGQDTTVMLYSHPVSKSFGMKNVYIQHAGKATKSSIILEFENDVQIENLTITESNTLHPLIVSQIGFYDTSYYKNIHIFNTRGGAAFQEMSANFNEELGTTYYENISIINHRPILENQWTGAGGGLVVFGKEGFQNRKVEIKNILSSENQYLDNMWSGVSAMWLSMGDYTITNATIADNLSDGSMAVGLGSGNFRIYNSVFYGNETGNIQVHENSDVQIYNSLLYGGENSIHQLSSENVNIDYDEATNLDENPFFSEHEDFFYYLMDESPCINSGSTDIPGMELPETDIIGNPRVYDGQVDMGAYEYVGPVGNNDFPYPVKKEKPSMIHIFPNPMIDYAKIKIKSKKEGKNRVFISTINGNPIVELCNTSKTTLNSIFIFENSKYKLPSGNYLVVLEVDGAVVESQQLVVVK